MSRPRAPEKRDFMSTNPERTAHDFYRNYDPVVGIGTVGILFVIILMVSLKSIVRWLVEKYKLWSMDRSLRAAERKQRTPRDTLTRLPHFEPGPQDGLV